MKAPTRIQRRRTKGRTLPPNTVCVCRPGPWGNPFIVGKDGTAAECVALHRELMNGYVCVTSRAEPSAQQRAYRHARANIDALRGKSLACWCRLDQACHADTLLELANGTGGAGD